MYSKSFTCCMRGIDADLIQVEVDVAKGIPAFNIVGLADKSINEAKERISVALRVCDFEMPPQRVLVNLSPAHLKKEGVHFDLAITAALMVNFNFININSRFLENFVFFAELGLEGGLKKSKDLLVLALSKNIKAKYIILPKANLKEAQVIQRAYGSKKNVFVISDLHELKLLLESLGNNEVEPEYLSQFKVSTKEEKDKNETQIKLDFADVLGQSLAKRAFEIAAAGNHHLLMIGPPGCGKTMLANRYINLLPKLKLEQAIETTKIYNASGFLTEGLIEKAPLRKPHHSLSKAAFVGGGAARVKPGEISLAHNGVLFLDEMTEFSKHTLEQLRQVLEEKQIQISRIKESQNYPADFLLLAACNPCPCGYLGDLDTNCRCSQLQIEKYLGKLSGPLLDRIDLHLRLNKISADTLRLLGKNTKQNYGTKKMLEKINAAKEFAQTDLELESEANDFMHEANTNLKLSARSHTKVIKVARTIANLEQEVKIKTNHLQEALQYRAINWQNYK
jgi:magnesium chelatase family protein